MVLSPLSKKFMGCLSKNESQMITRFFKILRGDRRHRLLLGGADSKYSLGLDKAEESLLRSQTAATTARAEVHWDEAGTNKEESEEDLETTGRG